MTETTRRTRDAGSLRSSGLPNLHYERRAWAEGWEIVAGVDEAGRGAWAGPLVAAAAIVPRAPGERARLTRALNLAGLVVNDSKQLTAAQRTSIRAVLGEMEVPCAVAEVSVTEIDAMGVGQANRIALARAAANLHPQPHHLLVDAFDPLEPHCGWRAIVRGDAVSFAIALASIVAKVHRDGLMECLDAVYPQYRFSAHKGYGTRLHQEALLEHGVSVQHRRSFAPIAEMLLGADAER